MQYFAETDAFGSQDLSGDDIKLVDYTVSYIKYGKEEVLTHGRVIVKEEMRGCELERDILKSKAKKNDKDYQDRFDNVVGEPNPDDYEESDIWVQWYVIERRPRDDAKFEQRRTEAQETGSKELVEAIRELTKATKKGG